MSNLIVVKFGGTSVRDLEHLINAAHKVRQEVEKGHQVVAVVSAQAGVTDRLIQQFDDAVQGIEVTQKLKAKRDALLATGEQENAKLFAQVLRKVGLQSQSFSGDKIPLHVSGDYGCAEVDHVDTEHLLAFMEDTNFAVPVVPGFQGVNDQGQVMTIGRGGSDLTAVELAIALKAKRCDIYTDVEGVFTADPRICSSAVKYENVEYGDMLNMAQQGAKVLEKTCVERSMNNGMRLQVLSSRLDDPVGSCLPGTLVSSEPTELLKGEGYFCETPCVSSQSVGGQVFNYVPG